MHYPCFINLGTEVQKITPFSIIKYLLNLKAKKRLTFYKNKTNKINVWVLRSIEESK